MTYQQKRPEVYHCLSTTTYRNRLWFYRQWSQQAGKYKSKNMGWIILFWVSLIKAVSGLCPRVLVFAANIHTFSAFSLFINRFRYCTFKPPRTVIWGHLINYASCTQWLSCHWTGERHNRKQTNLKTKNLFSQWGCFQLWPWRLSWT